MSTPNLSKSMGLIAAVVFVSTAIASHVTTANAQAHCMTYGKLALQQQRENEQKNCKFSGPSWSSDLKKHIKWCATVGPDQWKTELQKRAKMLTDECG